MNSSHIFYLDLLPVNDCFVFLYPLQYGLSHALFDLVPHPELSCVYYLDGGMLDAGVGLVDTCHPVVQPPVWINKMKLVWISKKS